MTAEPIHRRVIIFSGQYDGPAMVEHVEAVADAFGHWQITVLQEDPPRQWGRYLRGKVRRLRREPISYPLELAGQVLKRFRRPRSGTVVGNVHLPGRLAQIDRPNVDYRRCESLHTSETLAFVRSLDLWLGLAIGVPILKPNLFELPENGTINLHKGLLPDYRGMPPAFWELHDGVARTGVTVHWIDAGLDTGNVLAQQTLSISPHATVEGTAAQLDLAGTDALLEVLRRIDAGQRPAIPQPNRNGRTHRRPSWRVSRQVRRRLARRRHPQRSLPKRLREAAKRTILAAYVHLWAPVRNFACGIRG